MKYLFLLLFSLCFWNFSIAQTPVLENLRTELSQVNTDEQRSQILIKILEQSFSLHPDSFANTLKALKPLVKPGTVEYMRMKIFEVLLFSKSGKNAEAQALIDSLEKAFPDTKEFKRTNLLFQITRASFLVRNNKTNEAINSSFSILQKAEEMHDTIIVLRSYILLGYALMEIEKYSEAIKWLGKGIGYTNDEQYLSQCGLLFSNIASCYNNVGNIDTAFYFINKALYYGQLNQNFSVLTNALNIRADMYLNKGDFSAAENDLKAALEIRKKIGEVMMIVSDMGQLATFYSSTNQTDKGIEIAKRGLEIAKANKNISKTLYLEQCLAENYKKANRYDDYANSLENILMLKDSINQQNSNEVLAEMEMKYEVAKKEKIILQKELDVQQSRNFSILSLVVLLTSLIVVWLYYKNYQTRQKLKLEKAMADQKQLSLIEVHNAQESERKRIAADLHDNLGSYAAAITNNVNALKPSISAIDNGLALQLEENAQSMVTQLSDTIWVLKNEHLPLTKLADRFKSWLQKLMRNYPEVKYFYTENIEHDLNFNPEKILHIFLIMKECVNNALKHSGCSEIEINVVSDDIIQITIEDNGKGFTNLTTGDGQGERLGGNGIENIKHRASLSGWEVEWKSQKNNGTKVILSVDTTN